MFYPQRQKRNNKVCAKRLIKPYNHNPVLFRKWETNGIVIMSQLAFATKNNLLFFAAKSSENY